MRITTTILLCIVASAIAYSPTNNVAGNYHSRAAVKGEETSSFSTKLLMAGPNDTPIQQKQKYSESYMIKLKSNALAAKEDSKRARDIITNAKKLALRQQSPSTATDKRFLGNLGDGPPDTTIQQKQKYSESYMIKLRSNALAAKEDSKRARDIDDAQKLALKGQSPSTTDKSFLGNCRQGLGDAAKRLVGVTVAVGKGVVSVTGAATKYLVGVTFATALFTGKIIIRILIPWFGMKDVE
jgi:hypothetical protein